MKSLFSEFMSEQTPVMTFKEFCEMNEAPMVFKGDFGSDYMPVTYMATSGMKATGYTEVKNVGTNDYVKDYEIMVGKFNAVIGQISKNSAGEEKFAVYCKLDFSTYSKLETEKTVKVRLVTTATDKRIQDTAFTLYKSLIMSGYTIVSDNEQYQGAVALWKKLMSDKDIKISFYDEKSDTKSTNLTPEKIWSKDPDESNFDVVIVASKK